MPNKNYERGRRFEYTVLNKLKDTGIFDGLRSAGSHSAVDLIVWERNVCPALLYLIQCKHSSDGDVSFNTLFAEDNVIELTQMPDNFIKVLCIKQPRSRDIIQLVWYNNNGLSNPTWQVKRIFDI